jgi:predicted DNA-binding transcriptional regulator YafY
VMAAVPEGHRRRIEQARARIHVDPISWSQYDEAVPHLATLQQAVLNERRLRLLYRKGNGDIVERVVDPLGLVAKATIWYLVGRYTDPAGQLRVFRVSRVLEASEQGNAGERPSGFDLAAYWQSWSAEFSALLPHYQVTVRMDPTDLLSVTSILGLGQPSLLQGKTTQPDGTICLTLSYDSLDHALSRLLPAGALLEVVEPLELRTSIVELASHILSLYSSSAQ